MKKKSKRLALDSGEKNYINININKNNEPHGKKKKNKILRAIIRVILVIIVIMASITGGLIGCSIIKGNGTSLKGLTQTILGQSNEDIEKLEEFKVLILGISDDIDVALTDTIMVASYNPKTQKAVLFSIPRDTFIGNSMMNTNSYDKINAIYQSQGAEGVMEKVNKITGLDIEYYLVIRNNALVELVDEIGGVEFDVPINMDYDSRSQDLHIHLEAGLQTLNGKQAEWLVRFRKNNNGTTYPAEYGNDDYGRMKTQREFLKVVAKKTLQLKNLTKIGDLMDIVERNVETNIPDWDTIKAYIPTAIGFNTENIEMASLPGSSQRIPAETGLWFFLHNQKETDELIEELFGKDGSLKTKSEVEIEVINGSGDSTILTQVVEELENEGYSIIKTGTTNSISKTTIVNKNNINSDILDELQDILDTSTVLNSSTVSSSAEMADIVITIGEDYIK